MTTIAELAKLVNGVVEGNGSAKITGLSSLEDAVEGDLAFFNNARSYRARFLASKASALLVPKNWQGQHSATIIRVADPDAAFEKIAPLFAPPPVQHLPGIHPTAIIEDGTFLGRGCTVGAYAVIGKNCAIGSRCIIEAHVVLGEFCILGDDVHLYPHVSVREHTKMGNRVTIHNGTVIGSDGYGYSVSMDARGRPVIEKVQQRGCVELADDVEIGANVTIDRARFDATRIGRSTKIDNLVQIGHNVQVGECTGIIAQAGIAGSTRIGNGVVVWSQAGISGHISVGDRAHVRPQAGVKDDVAAGDDVIGTPAVSKKEFVRQALLTRQVEKLKEQVAVLEANIANLQTKE